MRPSLRTFSRAHPALHIECEALLSALPRILFGFQWKVFVLQGSPNLFWQFPEIRLLSSNEASILDLDDIQTYFMSFWSLALSCKAFHFRYTMVRTVLVMHWKAMHQVHTLLLKTASASRFSSCLSSLKARSSLRTSSSRTCSSNVLIRLLLWRIKSLQIYTWSFAVKNYLFIHSIKIFFFLFTFLTLESVLLKKQSFGFWNLQIFNVLFFLHALITFYQIE